MEDLLLQEAFSFGVILGPPPEAYQRGLMGILKAIPPAETKEEGICSIKATAQ